MVKTSVKTSEKLFTNQKSQSYYVYFFVIIIHVIIISYSSGGYKTPMLRSWPLVLVAWPLLLQLLPDMVVTPPPDS